MGKPNAQAEEPSQAQKRFKVTATGKVIAGHAGKHDGMIKRTKKQIRRQYQETLLAERLIATLDQGLT
nr:MULTISPECIES: 50S ribosomal protein L35 [Bradyrhizobium]